MDIVYSDQHRLFHPTSAEVFGNVYVFREVPERAVNLIEALRAADIGPILPPENYGLSPILTVHRQNYVDYLSSAYALRHAMHQDGSPVIIDAFNVQGRHRPSRYPGIGGLFTFDNAAPILAGTFEAAYGAAQIAVTAAEKVRHGESVVYALCRPPGHHAAADLSGGYCYLNNAAIAARHLQAGIGAKVAILDIDYHHGNGTQEIFYTDLTVLYCSIHADPDEEYPFFWGGRDERGEGTGFGFNCNWPLPAGTDDATYLGALDESLLTIQQFKPDFLIVSVGFDLMHYDPETVTLGFSVTLQGLTEIGRRIAALNLPTVIVQEGGYNLERLGEYVVTFLRAFLP